MHLGLGNAYWSEISFWMIAAGVVTGLLAAPFGFADWLAIPSGTRAKRIGALHGAGNVIVVLLYGASWLTRVQSPRAGVGARVSARVHRRRTRALHRMDGRRTGRSAVGGRG